MKEIKMFCLIRCERTDDFILFVVVSCGIELKPIVGDINGILLSWSNVI